MNNERRVVITGLGINTPIGDDLETFYQNLLAGKSAITRWKWMKNENVYSKVGGDLSEYDVKAKLARLRDKLPAEMHKRARVLCNKAPFSTSLSVLCAADAWLDAGLPEGGDPTRRAVLVGGHNLNERYFASNYETFLHEEPDYIDSMAALHMLDTDHAGSVCEMLGWQGSAYTMGGACASANVALRSGIDPGRLVLDPGLGFAKAGEHNLVLLAALAELRALGRPLLIGASRKSFLGRLLHERGKGERPVDDRDDATQAITAVAAWEGAWGVRVHAARAAADAVRVVAAIQAARP